MSIPNENYSRIFATDFIDLDLISFTMIVDKAKNLIIIDNLGREGNIIDSTAN